MRLQRHMGIFIELFHTFRQISLHRGKNTGKIEIENSRGTFAPFFTGFEGRTCAAMINQAIFNRTPLAPNAFAPLPVGAVKPRGYLLSVERMMASAITGNLPRVWDSMRDNAWMGGKGESWERGPYYLDGLLPLAWQLGDEELKNTAMKFVEWTLSSQREDGFFGPADNEDWWPRMVMLKCLQQYFTATGD